MVAEKDVETKLTTASDQCGESAEETNIKPLNPLNPSFHLIFRTFMTELKALLWTMKVTRTL